MKQKDNRGEPPVGPGDQHVEGPPKTRDERRAATMNRRHYDRETGHLPTRAQAAQEHA